MTANPLLKGLRPTHPGELLREMLITPDEALVPILNEREPITVATALRIGELTRSDPEMWLRLQRAHDEACTGTIGGEVQSAESQGQITKG